MKEQEMFQKIWAEIVVEAWNNEDFKQRLLKDPLRILEERGIKFQSGVTCKIHEDSSREVHLSLPTKPKGPISRDSMKKMAAAGSHYPCIIMLPE